MAFFSKLLSAGAGREIKRFQERAVHIGDLEPDMVALDDDELAAQTVKFRERIANGADLDDILDEAFATVREASKRTTGLRHFDVQLIGGMVLNAGQIAEMKTGEGKTLVSTLAGYLNAIPGKGVHIVTVNDYLAKRDSEWMGQIYRKLGMEVGLIQNGMKIPAKRPAYQADVTYGTNSEFGFDYLRDNMVTRSDLRVQRGHVFAVVDEVDSILIDEARTPLIISGAGTKAAETYIEFARIMPHLIKDVDFEMEEDKHIIVCTEAGLTKVEGMLGRSVYDDPTGQLPNHLQQALKAQFMFHKDVDYVNVDGEIKIVDEFTGRIMEGRRYSEGLHQAIEAKEGVLVREENQTLATITLQNYFRLYEKLSGMTGTAMTEDSEFRDIYKLSVQEIPPNKPVIRQDEDDLVYRTIDAKFNAVADEITERHAAGQPVLVGTVSIESSERLSRLLQKRGIKHEILNAKHHEREAHIVAQAGRKGAVTIATNMAGRGTDILLGGNPTVLAEDMLRLQGFDPDADPDKIAEIRATVTEQLNSPDPKIKARAKKTLDEMDEWMPAPTEEAYEKAFDEAQAICAAEHDEVIKAGGLMVIGTERHESRRIDNQLRGRSGRQGDPGVTQFYLSLEDDLMRVFGGDRMDKISDMMQRTKMPDDMPIQAGMVSKAIENAQRNVESMNFSSRKHVLEYDDVMNTQRQVIYEERNAILDGKDIHDKVDEIIVDTVNREVAEYVNPKLASDDWDFEGMQSWFNETTGVADACDLSTLNHDDDVDTLCELICDEIRKIYKSKEAVLGEKNMRTLERQIMLRVIDTRWMNHLSEMDYLRSGIGLRGYGQRDPLTEYKTEAYRAFGELVDTMYEDFLRTILRIRISVQQPEAPQSSEDNGLSRANYSGPASPDGDQGTSATQEAARRMAVQQTGAGQQVLKPTETKTKTYVKDKNDPYANVGRNDPCPCGSGKKFKKCHGAVQNQQ